MSDKDLQARLARGERGIPKIPDSPDTRHAQAQPPRPNDWRDFIFAEIDRLCEGQIRHEVRDGKGEVFFTISANGIEYQRWDDVEHFKSSMYKRVPFAFAAHPAEQPAPPRTSHPIGELRFKNGETWAERKAKSADSAQPSAPPQPAEQIPVCDEVAMLKASMKRDAVDEKSAEYSRENAEYLKSKRYDALEADVAKKSCVVKNKSTEAGREFWGHVEKIAAKVNAEHPTAAPSVEARIVADKNDAREWWMREQDNFIKDIRGAGLDTHSLYDVPAALTAYAAAVTQQTKDEIKFLRGAVVYPRNEDKLDAVDKLLRDLTAVTQERDALRRALLHLVHSVDGLEVPFDDAIQGRLTEARTALSTEVTHV